MEIKVKLIGLAGKKRSGKNLAAQYIRDILQKKNPSLLTGDIGFADGVKYVAAEALSINRMTFFEDKNKENLFRVGGTDDAPVARFGRDILQRVGTEMFRETLCDDFWVYRLMKVIKDQPDFFFIVTDIRFPNEVKAIEDAGGVVIRLLRNTGLKDEHESETILDDWEFSYFISNNETKPYLYMHLEAIIKKLNI